MAHVTSTSNQQRKSLYERLTSELEHDEKVMRDVALGKRIGLYKFKGHLGSGNFSSVKFGVHLLSNEKVAVKVIDKLKLDDHARRLLSNEVACMEQLDHPNILSLFEVIDTFHKMYIVTEFASSGDMQERVNGLGPMGEEEGRIIFVQLVSAVEHMHRKHISHRDLKAENVFFVTASHVKVGDFGFSVQSNSPTLNTFCGSPPYAAPELFLEEGYSGPMVDIWALGILLYFMLTGSLPFKAQTIPLLKVEILEGKYVIPSNLSSSCQNLISGVLTRNPQERTDLHAILGCSWLHGAKAGAHAVLAANGCSSSSSSRSLAVDTDLIGVLERWGVPPSELRQVGLLREPRSSADGAYRILVHRKRNAVPLDPLGSSIIQTLEVPPVLSTEGRCFLEQQDKKRRSSQYCGIL